MSFWYELDLQLKRTAAAQYYEYNLLNRCSENAGFDLFCVQPANLAFGEVTLLRLGVAAALTKVTEDGTRESSHFWLVPRSSIFKKGVMMANSIGVIDRGYRGELGAPVWSMLQETTVSAGERLFQVVAPDMGWIRHVRVVDTLPSTQQAQRGERGFGSSGR